MHQGRVEEPSRHAARRHGPGRRPRGAHEGHRPAQGRDRSRHGRPVQQQEPRQARHLAQRPPPQGPRDRQAAGGHVRHRRRGLLARRARQLGARLRDMREIKPDIIYVQQSGMGAQGTYGRFRTVGPIAAAFAGLSEMSGLPEPAMPAGWGYSYLDWMGAYSFCACHAGRAVPPRAHRRGPVDRRVAIARSASSSPARRSSTGRPTAASGPAPATARLEAGGAARRLSVRGRGPLDRHRLLHRGRVARADDSGRAAGVGGRSALCDARRPSRQSGCARRAGRRAGRGVATPAS